MANIDFGNSVEVQFQTKLIEIYGEGKKTVLIKRDDYFKLIEDIKIAKSASSKTKRQYYILGRLVIHISSAFVAILLYFNAIFQLCLYEFC